MISTCFATIIISTTFFISSPHFLNERKHGEISFNRYLRYEEIQDYLQQLNSTKPKLVHVDHYGLSHEKRYLTYIKISLKEGYTNKPMIFLDAGIHAREWISPAVALYTINQLIDPKNRMMLVDIEWLIVPLVNPDGYEYSHVKDRLWRKNRSKHGTCTGVDLNRNFDFKWLTVGASSNECSQYYAGIRPFSEPESSALSLLILEYAKNIKLYVSFHSPYQAILYPWSYNTRQPKHSHNLYNTATNLAFTISIRNSTEYTVGTFANELYLASGTSMDWVYGVANITFAFTIELTASNNLELSRFIVPPNEILKIADEMFHGIKLLPYHVRKYAVVKRKTFFVICSFVRSKN